MGTILIKKIEGFRRKSNGIITTTSHLNVKVGKDPGVTGSLDYLKARNVYPFAVDFAASCIYFIETNEEIKHNDEPFFYDPLQSESAKNLIKADIREFTSFLATLHLRETPRIVFIHHSGRCGSTLLHKLLASHPEVESFSEDLVIENTLSSDYSELGSQLYRLLVLFTAHKFIGESERLLVFKLTGRKFRWADRLREMFPEARIIYLTRDPVKISESILNLMVGALWSGLLHSLFFYFGMHNVKRVPYSKSKSPDGRVGFDFEDPFFDLRRINTAKQPFKISMSEMMALRVLIRDQFFSTRASWSNLLILRYEDILSKASLERVLGPFLGSDLMSGIDPTIYDVHSQTGKRIEEPQTKFRKFTERERKNLQAFLAKMSDLVVERL